MNDEIQKTYIQFPALATEIKQMFDEDQDMRGYDLVDPEGGHWDETLDKRNTERVKEIISEHGLLGSSKIGKDAAYNLYLLIQHADHDVVFQLQCLTLMQNMPEGEFRKEDIAFLTDRTRVNQDLPQVYGTQFKEKDGKHIPKTIEHEENVDLRRAEMGMGTLAERIAEMHIKYPL